MIEVLKKVLQHIKRGTLLTHAWRRADTIFHQKTALRAYKHLGKVAPIVGVREERFTYVVSTADYSTGFKLFDRSAHLRERMEILYEWGKANLECFQDPSKILVNVGANIGCAVIPSVSKGYFSSAIAFEPEPLNYKLLGANIHLNGAEKRIQTYQIALSNENKRKLLYTSEHNLGAHAVMDVGLEGKDLRGRDRENNLTFGNVQVTCRTFDSFAQEHGIQIKDIGLVIVDIEGHEGHFFEGAQTLLEQKIPVLIEFCPSFLKRSGGLEKFLDHATRHYSRVLFNPLKRSPANFEVWETNDLRKLADSEGLFDLLLVA